MSSSSSSNIFSSSSESEGNTSSSSSSSSAPEPFTDKIHQIIAGDSSDNVIFFTYEQENGFEHDGNNQEISFSFKTVNNYFFNYQNLLSPENQETIENVSNCYVPNILDSDLKSDPIFYVDLIVKDSGIKDLNVRSQENNYGNSEVKYSFLIPKFGWSDQLIVGEVESSLDYTPLDDSEGSFWAGTLDEKLHKIEYNSETAKSSYNQNEDGIVRGILNNPNGSDLYITTEDKIKRYICDHYYGEGEEKKMFFEEKVSLDNEYKILSYYDGSVLASLPETGFIEELDGELLSVISSIDGFDSPFKVIKSQYHDAIFVAGTNVLWKYDGNLEAVYSIEGYKISDFDISKNGKLCIALNGRNDSYIRILDRNFFRMIKNEKIIKGNARFCKFLSNNYFIAISEIDIGGDQFVIRSFLYNTVDGSYNVVNSPNVLKFAEDEQDQTPAENPIDILYPNGGENLLIGSEVNLSWKSNKSITDEVKIELYQNDQFIRTISNFTSNDGSFNWKIPNSIEESDNYKIKIQWLAAEVNPDNEDLSDKNFSILKTLPEDDTDFFLSVGCDYDNLKNRSIIVLKSGLLGLVDFDDFSFIGWIDTGTKNYTSIAIKNDHIKEIEVVSKVRIFVGSSPYLSNKWDSGIMETNLKSIYYGGGNNLVPGEVYYVNIQVFSDTHGWSEIQTKKFIMPKK